MPAAAESADPPGNLSHFHRLGPGRTGQCLKPSPGEKEKADPPFYNPTYDGGVGGL